MKHFTIIELGADSESPMIGTVMNVYNEEPFYEEFKLSVVDALTEHFDSDDIHFIQEFPDMFAGVPYEDVKISVQSITYVIRIMETWLY